MVLRQLKHKHTHSCQCKETKKKENRFIRDTVEKHMENFWTEGQSDSRRTIETTMWYVGSFVLLELVCC